MSVVSLLTPPHLGRIRPYFRLTHGVPRATTGGFGGIVYDAGQQVKIVKTVRVATAVLINGAYPDVQSPRRR